MGVEMVIKAKKFVVSFVIALPLLFVLYGASLVAWFSYVDTFPSNYKAFLISQTPSPKVVVASGSNARTGIAPAILEEYFNAAVVNYGDIASFPSDSRMRLIEPYMQAGDTLILPFEYRLYASDVNAYNTTFGFRVALGSASEYFRDIDLLDKLALVYFYMPPRQAYDTIVGERRLLAGDAYIESRLKEYSVKALGEIGVARGSLFGEEKTIRKYGSHNASCDEYVFSTAAASGRVSRMYKEAFKVIQRMKERGVTVVYTWPVIAAYYDNECMTSPMAEKAIDIVRAQVMPQLEANEIPFIGSQQDVRFGQQYFFDSYYHVTRAGAEKRTRILVKELRKAGVKPYDNPEFSSVALSKKILRRIQAMQP